MYCKYSKSSGPSDRVAEYEVVVPEVKFVEFLARVHTQNLSPKHKHLQNLLESSKSSFVLTVLHALCARHSLQKREILTFAQIYVIQMP